MGPNKGPIGPWAHGLTGPWARAWARGPGPGAGPQAGATLGAGPLRFPRNPQEKRDPEKRPSGPIFWGPGRAVFGISWKFAARGATRHLIWSREGPNQAIFENPYLGQPVPFLGQPVARQSTPLVNQAWTDLNYVGLRPPAGRCPGRLKAPRASTLIKSAFGLLRSAFGLARTVGSLGCREDICCVSSQDICCVSSQESCNSCNISCNI